MNIATIDRLYREILGPFPERVPLNVELVERIDVGDHSRELIAYDNDANERVHAYVLRPKGFSGPRPAVLVFHGHGKWELGKTSTAIQSDQSGKIAMGPLLAKRGFVVICGDAIGWGHRQPTTPKPTGMMYERVVAMRLLAQGRCMANQYVWDAMRQCDVLETFSDVDASRIGATGVSMGSGHTWLSAMVEPRLKAMVAVSSFYTYRALYEPPIQHCYMNYLPDVLKYGMETYDLFGLIAPRPMLMINGTTEEQDPLDATRELYEKALPHWHSRDAEAHFRLHIHEGGHGHTPESRDLALDFLAEHLRP